MAFDTVTREADEATAAARIATLAERWWSDFGGLAFMKVDSVWRGHPAVQIARAMEAGRFDVAVIAPAFPEQGRITRHGGQWVRDAGGAMRCIVGDLVADLCAAGVRASRDGLADASARAWVCDASDPSDLASIVRRHADHGSRRLWCGTAGLAHALADTATQDAGGPGSLRIGAHRAAAIVADAMRDLRRPSTGPVLVLVGSDHPVAQAQANALAAMSGVAEVVLDLAKADGPLPPIDATKGTHVMLVRFAAPAKMARVDAQAHAQRLLKRLMPGWRPCLAIVTGGETLRALAEALDATALAVHGERSTGVPQSIWVDGAWAGLPVFSKSGGFGAPDLFHELASRH